MSLLIALALGTGWAYADSVVPSFTVGATTIHFYVDGKSRELPPEVISAIVRDSSGATSEILSQILVKELTISRKIRDININARTADKDHLVLDVQARSAWTVRQVLVLGNNGEQPEESRLQAVLDVKPGQPLVSFQNLEFDSARIDAALRAEGYLKARVRYKAIQAREGEVDVIFQVDRGNPCLVADFKPLKDSFGIFKTIRSGDLCNKTQLATRMREEEVRIRNQGFINARLQFDPETDLIPTRDQERATLQYTYSAGEQWRLSIANSTTGAALEEQFMSETGFVLGDLAYTSQEELRLRIQAYFQSLGYADASVVAVETERDSTGRRRDLQFEVDLGRKVTFDADRTEFTGDLPISREEAIEALGIQPGLLSLGEGVPFDERTLGERKEKLTELYVNMGYLDAKIEKIEVFRAPSAPRAWLRIRSLPGRRHKVRTVSLMGKPLDFDEHDTIVSEYLKVGDPLRPTALRKLEGVLQNELNSAGYRLANVQVPEAICKEHSMESKEKKLSLHCQNGSNGDVDVDVVLRISAGPLFRVGAISSSNVPFDKGATALEISGLHTGDVLSPRVLAQARDRILKHGLFGNVVFQGSDSFALADSERRQKEVFRDITIVATRPRNWSLTLNPSWNSDRGYGFRSDFQRNNLTQDGLQLFFQGLLTQDRYQNTGSNGPTTGQIPGLNLSVGLREAFFRIGNWISPLDFNLATVGHELDAREERRLTTRVQSDITWRPNWFGIDFQHKFELAYSYSSYALGGVSRPVRVIDRSNDIGIIEATVSTGLDTRDNPVWPRSGFLTNLSAGHSGKETGSDVSFDKFTADLSLFGSLFRWHTQSFSLGLRHVTSPDAPGGRREKITGLQVRGFPESAALLGPLLWYPERDIGGKCNVKLIQAAATNVFSARSEAKFRRPQTNFGWVLFFDSALAYFSPSEASQFNNKLAALSGETTDTCAPNKARIVGNDAIDMGLRNNSFLNDYLRSSYQAVGLGLRWFLVDLLAIHVDWGIPLRDPAESGVQCVRYSRPYRPGSNSENPLPPACIKRKPQYDAPWDTPTNVFFNSLDFLIRPQISIEGKF